MYLKFAFLKKIFLFSILAIFLLISVFLPITQHKKTLLTSKVCSFICEILKINIHIANESRIFDKKIARKNLLILSNHISYMDIVIISALFNCRFVAKAEIKKWPIIGKIAEGFGCIFVDRSNLLSRVSAINQIRKALKTSSVCVFPEGTTTKEGVPCEKKWSRGQIAAANLNYPNIVCIGIAYENQDKIAWVDDQKLLPHMLNVFATQNSNCYLSGEQLQKINIYPTKNLRVAAQKTKEHVKHHSIMANKLVNFSRDEYATFPINFSLIQKLKTQKQVRFI